MSDRPAPAPSVRRFSQAQVGEQLPTLHKHVGAVTNFLFAVPFWAAHRIHYDAEQARREGFDGAVVIGALLNAYIARVVVSWAGRPEALRRLASRSTATLCVGGEVTVTGHVTELRADGRRGGLALCELRAVDGDGVLLVSAQADVALPA
jgi:acyl dehydratase